MELRGIGDASRLSHAYIVSSNSQEAGYETARKIAAAAVCTGSGTKPCGYCRSCRKAEKQIHPDIITITRLTDEKGKPKKFITVDQIRELKIDALVAPNESERKVYIIREADKMNMEAQNAALKLLEEPPRSVLLILCAENAKSLLVTVRSRCKEIVCNAQPEPLDEQAQKTADAYLKTLAGGNRLRIAEFCYDNEGISVQDMQKFTECVMLRVTDMLSGRETGDRFTPEQLMTIYRQMEDFGRRLTVNTSPKLLMGVLMTERPGQKDNNQRKQH